MNQLHLVNSKNCSKANSSVRTVSMKYWTTLKTGMNAMKSKLTRHELLAHHLVRQMTIVGNESYDVWCVAELMVQYSLESQDHPDLFPPNQRLTPKRYAC